MLDASIMGKHVYDKLGFQDVCSIHAMKIAPQDLRRLIQRLDKEAGRVSETSGALSGGQKLEGEDTGLLGSILRDITENEFGQDLLSARVAEAAVAVQPIREEDTWQAVIACDGQVFGADRALLLRQWQRRNPACAVWLPNLGLSRALEEVAGTSGRESTSLGGPVEGYAFAHSRRNYQYVGPIVAGNRASAGALLLAQLKQIAQQDSDKACFIYVMEPPEGPRAGKSSTWDEYLVWCRWLESLGFRRELSTVRQVLGEAPDNTSLQHYFAVGSLDLG